MIYLSLNIIFLFKKTSIIGKRQVIILIDNLSIKSINLRANNSKFIFFVFAIKIIINYMSNLILEKFSPIIY